MMFPRIDISWPQATRWLSLILWTASLGCSASKPTASEPVRPVKTLVVAAGEDTHTRAFPAKAEASSRVQLAFQVPGILASLPVKAGQKVAQGEVIAQLRQDEFAAQLKSLQSDLDQARAALRALLAGDRPEERLRRESQVRAAEARLANSKAEYDRSTRLIRTSAISQSEYDRSQTEYRIAQEELQSARQLLELGTIGREEDIDAQSAVVRGLEARVVEANLRLQDSTLRAPYDGVIAERFVEEGQNVRAKEPIVKFQDIDELEVVIDVPEAIMAANLRSADIVQLEAEFVGAPGLRFPVQVREIAQRADPTTQTFSVRAAMAAPPDQIILPGMSATVTLTYRRANVLGSRILVPISAVFKDSSGEQIVWVIETSEKAGETVSRRAVKVGEVSGDQIVITDGLQPGDRIAVAGVSFLRDGMKVRDLGDELGGGQR